MSCPHMAQTCANSTKYSPAMPWAALCAHGYGSMSTGIAHKKGGKPGESQAEG